VTAPPRGLSVARCKCQLMLATIPSSHADNGAAETRYRGRVMVAVMLSSRVGDGAAT
jgi:hypothetical protein